MLSNQKNLSLLVLGFTLCVLSVSMYDSILLYVHSLAIIALGMRTALYFSWQKHLPTVRTLNLLAILCALILAYMSISLGMLVAMTNLLTMACALKLMIVRRQKDFYQLIAASYFLVGVGFIFDQSLFYTVIYLTCCFLLLLSLIDFHGPSLSIKRKLKQIGTMSLQAIPLAVILFLVLPKLPPLWQMPTSKPGESGLSDSVEPGRYRRLVSVK